MLRSTLRRSLKVVAAHFFCAAAACSMARSMPSGVEGLMKPRSCPVAGA